MEKEGLSAGMLAQQLKHQFKLEQYTDEELLKINMTMAKVEREILHDWDVKIKTDFSKANAVTLLEETRELTKAVKETMSTSLAEMLGKVSATSASAHSKILSFGGAAAKVNDVILQEPLMTSFWKTTPVGGHLLKDWVSKTFDIPTIDKIQQEIATGMFKGESYAALGKRLKEGFGMSKVQIDTLVRTYVHTANIDALKRTYEANKDVVKRVRWSAAYDKRTCLVCAVLEGQLFLLADVPPCPVHPRCRCALVPDTSFAKLGLDKEKAKEWLASEKADPTTLKGALFQSGKLNKDMKGWIFNLPLDDQRKFFGPKRFDLLQKGLIQFEDLVDMNTYKIKTLAQLQGDVDLNLKVKQGIPEAMAEKAAKEEAKKFQAALVKEQHDAVALDVITKAKAAEEAEALAQAQAKQAALLKEQEAALAAKAAKKEGMAAELAAMKEEYYAASEAGTLDFMAKEKMLAKINDLEYGMGGPLSSFSSLEKVVGERKYYKGVIENYKKSYAQTDDLDQKALYLEKINKAEAKLGPYAKKTTFYDLEQHAVEHDAKLAFAEALAKQEVEAKAIRAAAKAEAKAKARELVKRQAAKEAAKKAAEEAAAIKAAEEAALAAKKAEASKKLSRSIKKGMAKKKAMVDSLKQAYTTAVLKGEVPTPEVAKGWADFATKKDVAQLEKAIKAKAAKEAADAAAKKAEQAKIWASYKNPDEVTVFTNDMDLPADKFKTLDAPDLNKPEVWEPEFHGKKHKGVSSGAIVFDEDTGKVFIYEPKDHFSGYEHTFPKGGAEVGLTLQQNAAKEIWEEIGLDVDILDYLGDYEKSTTVSRYYIAKVKGGNPSKFLPDETWNVKAVPAHLLGDYLNKAVDKNIAFDFANQFDAAMSAGHGDPVEGFKKLNATKKATAEAQAKAAQEAAEKAAASKKLSDSIKEGMAKKKAAEMAALTDKIAVLKQQYLDTHSDDLFQEWGAAEAALKKKLIADYKKEGLAMAEAKAKANKVVGNIQPKRQDGTFDPLAMLKAPTPAKAKPKGNVTLDGDQFEQYGGQEGSNEGGFYRHKTTGEKYYFKFLKSDAHIDNEILAAKLYEKAGVKGVAELTDVKMGGRRGLASKIIDDLEKDGAALSDAGSALNDAVKRDMAVDAWLANWDTVGIGYDNLKIKGGKAYHVDVGGSLLFRAQGGPKGAAFGEEVGELKTFLDANKNAYSAAVFKGITREQIVAGVKKVASMSDDDIRALVAEFGPKGKIADGLADTLIARKNWLIKEYPEAVQGVKAPKAAAPVPKARAARTEIIRKVDEKFTQDVKELGYQGKTVPFDQDHIEDQNALVFVEEFQGKSRAVVKMKTRPSADQDILAAIKDHIVGGGTLKKSMPTGPQPLKEDKYFDFILAAVKNVIYHGGDMNKINKTKWYAGVTLKRALKNLAASTKNDDAFKMAKHYLEWIDKLEKAVAKGSVPTGKFEQFLVDPPKPKPVAAPKPKAAAPFTVKQTGTMMTRRRSNKGKFEVVADDVHYQDLAPSLYNTGTQYRIDFADGTRIRYNPWDDSTLYAQRGELEVTLPGDATPGAIKEAFEKIKQIGINAKVADAVDAEKMYLEKLAYIHRVDRNNDYVAMMDKLKGATTEEKVTALQGYMSKVIGKDITKLPDYNPDGEYQIGFLDHGKNAGQRLQMRPDISKDDLDRELKNFTLHHNIFYDTAANLLEIAMENNGAMIATTDKFRVGIPLGGLSSNSDLGTGGANYFFTRLTDPKNPPQNRAGSRYEIQDDTLIFKKDMIRRMDAISYDGDEFGRTTGDFTRNNRKTDFDGWKQCSEYGDNETIFKNNVTLLDNLDYAIVPEHDRAKAIKVFTKRGITTMPDGRKVEDVVITMDQWRAIVRKMK